jgi:hypothetical protein
MRRPFLLAPLVLVSCSSLFQGDEPASPVAPPVDTVAAVEAAVDEERARTDAQDDQLRAALESLTLQVARLNHDLGRVREESGENASAALAAESAAASSQRMLLLTSVVAALTSVAALVLAIVVVWQAVLLRRAQREADRAQTLVEEQVQRAAQDQEQERAAMAATRTAPGAPSAPGAPATGPLPVPLARLRKRPPA